VVVQVDGVDGADAAAVPVEHGAALPGTDGVDVGHLGSFPFQYSEALLSTGIDSLSAST
jgi:hypothetical protein